MTSASHTAPKMGKDLLFPKTFDAIVIGGGHAGSEAAHALATLGCDTLLLTMNIDTIGHMSCNPAIGGLAKGHLVKEIDAMGGVMGRVADAAAIQYKRLNTSKGPAVRGSRAQCDMRVYRNRMAEVLMNTDNLSIKQGAVDDLLIEPQPEGSAAAFRVTGVRTRMGVCYPARTVVVTAGTFLRGKCHVGLSNFKGGRAGDGVSVGLSETLEQLELEMGRLKTGTTPRLDGRTIDWTRFELDPGDDPPRRFSFYWDEPMLEQVPCHIGYTNPETHAVIASATDRSPLFTGVIDGVGPRYCPSVEDKVVRFADKERHLIFLEPQGLDTHEIYPNGLSTSLPLDAQYSFLRTIEGMEDVEIMRPGYAVEYDFVNPIQLDPTLELRKVAGLFLAGQINGTSGYEEAAAQGLMAGLNAAHKIKGKPPVVLKRDEAYIGVLIDDLVTRGTTEPYRMFTSRAEFRLLLREDNADLRLSPLGHSVGLLPEEHYQLFLTKRANIEEGIAAAEAARIIGSDEINAVGERMGIGRIKNVATVLDLLKRPKVGFELAVAFATEVGADADAIARLRALSEAEAEQIEIQTMYAGYIGRQQDQADRLRSMEDAAIPPEFSFDTVHGLSNEVREKLDAARPVSVGQAARIPGITPAAISALMIRLKAFTMTADRAAEQRAQG